MSTSMALPALLVELLCHKISPALVKRLALGLGLLLIVERYFGYSCKRIDVQLIEFFTGNYFLVALAFTDLVLRS